MILIAGGHLYSRCDSDVETGFVMQQDNMRAFTSGIAGRQRRIQAFRCACVRLQISVCSKLMDRLDAGAGEFRDKVLADKILIETGRERERQRDQRGHA
jgi:hypothetical protein